MSETLTITIQHILDAIQGFADVGEQSEDAVTEENPKITIVSSEVVSEIQQLLSDVYDKIQNKVTITETDFEDAL